MRVKQCTVNPYNGQDPWTWGGMRVPSHPDFGGERQTGKSQDTFTQG